MGRHVHQNKVGGDCHVKTSGPDVYIVFCGLLPVKRSKEYFNAAGLAASKAENVGHNAHDGLGMQKMFYPKCYTFRRVPFLMFLKRKPKPF